MKSITLIALSPLCLLTTLALAAPQPAPAIKFVQVPGATATKLYGVSNNNVGVGFYLDSSNAQHGYEVANGKFTTIDNPGGTTYLWGVNSSGTVVGYYVDSQSNYNAFSWSNGVFTPIVPPGGSQSLAYGINDNGVITGEYLDPSTGLDEGFIFDGATYTTVLSPISGEPLLAFDTNVNGMTTVFYQAANGIDLVAAIYNGSTFTTANVPGATTSYIHEIDAAGDVVYSWADSSGVFHAAARMAGKYTKFNVPGCAGSYGDGINDHHVIVGTCDLGNGSSKGFYLTY
jgi:probable HAF family extracellular repeat protein